MTKIRQTETPMSNQYQQHQPWAPPDDSFDEIYSPPPPYNQLSVPVHTGTGDQRRVVPYGWSDPYPIPGPGELSMTSPVSYGDRIITPIKVSSLSTSTTNELENPFDQPRKFQDPHFLTAFGIFLIFMVIVAIFALSTGSLDISRGRGCIPASFYNQNYMGYSFNDPTSSRHIGFGSGTAKTEINRYAGETTYLAQYQEGNFVQGVTGNGSRLQVDRLVTVFVSMIFIALVLSIVMTILLKQFGGPIVWGVIFACVFLAALVSAVFWIAFLVTGNFVLMIIGVVVTISTIVLLLVIKVMKKRIQMVVRLFKEAGKAIQAVPLIVAQPFLTFVLLLIVTVIFAVVGFLLENSLMKDSTSGICWKPGFSSASRWVNMFAFFWVTQFLVGCQHMVVAGVITQWFFTRDKSNLGSPLLTSWRNTIRFHLGSIAFASLIIAFVKFVRFLIRMMRRSLKMVPNCIHKCIFRCCECIFGPAERFLISLNRNAYVEIAIYGDGYLKSARRAFDVIVNNVPALLTINSIGDFVLFLGKITVTGLTALYGYFVAKAVFDYNETLIYTEEVFWVVLIGTVFAFWISHCFLSVYEMAMDTIFICFCEDCEMNDGVCRPFYMSKKLMEFVQQSKE